MLVLSGQIFSAVLVLTGAAKLLRPTDTVRAVRALKIPLAQQTVYLIAIAEVTIGGAALALPSTYLFAAQAILYASFTVWVTAAMNSGVPVASCGCLGRDDTPPYWGHVVVNVSAVAVSVGAAWTVTDWSRPEFATLLFQVAMVATAPSSSGRYWGPGRGCMDWPRNESAIGSRCPSGRLRKHPTWLLIQACHGFDSDGGGTV